MADEKTNRDSFHIQAGYCAAMAAPITTRLATVLGPSLSRDSETGRRVLDWPGEPVADALVLRLIGGLHALHRRGVPEIAPVQFVTLALLMGVMTTFVGLVGAYEDWRGGQLARLAAWAGPDPVGTSPSGGSASTGSPRASTTAGCPWA